MKFNIILFILLVGLFFSCSKEKEIIPNTPPIIPEQWEKFIGNYTVYDTLGTYLYNMNIVHQSTYVYPNGFRVDSVILQNYADTFDVKYQFRETIDKNILDFGFHDSIIDQNNKSWGLWNLSEDFGTAAKENYLFNDTIILYFEMDNIRFYIPEAQPYFFCRCKHVAVKQP